MSQSGIMFAAAIIIAALVIALVAVLLSRIQLHQKIEMQQLLDRRSEEDSQRMQEFQQRISGQMLAYQNGLEDTVRAELQRLGQSSSSQLERLDARVNDSLLRGFEKTDQSFALMKAEMARIQSTQENLKALSQQLSSLQGVLTDKKTRGVFGEVELYSLLEQVFGRNDARWQRQYHLASGVIADAVLLSPRPLGLICIDSKFPMENFARMSAPGLSKAQEEAYRTAFARDVRKHITDIAEKYILPPDTAEVAYMFVPAEAVFAEIYGRFPDLIQYSYEKNVFIVSPTTLMAYLTAIRAIYLNQERNEKAAEMQEEYQKLGLEFDRFVRRFNNVSGDFTKTAADIHDLETTFQKMHVRFDEISAVQLGSDQDGEERNEKPI